MNTSKMLNLFVFNLLIFGANYARAEEMKSIKFMPKIEILMKGDTQYSVDFVTPEKFEKKYAHLIDLDSLSFEHEPKIKLMVGKSAYIVNKPAGFFDHVTTGDEGFISFVMGEQSVQKLSENSFSVEVPGESAHSYRMKTYFDSDDISTLPNSKVIKAVSLARKLDVISQSASSVVFKEMSKYSKYCLGAVQVSSYIPINENKTLVLNYYLSAIKDAYVVPEVLEKNFSLEIESQKRLTDKYSAPK